jgi:hypothetical protein
MMRLIRSALFLEFGLMLIVLPWSAYWDRNYFASFFPVLRALMINNFVRGAVSGLGIINVVAGVSELLSVYAGRQSAASLTIGRSHTAEE